MKIILEFSLIYIVLYKMSEIIFEVVNSTAHLRLLGIMS